jgi:hypothetical protein
MLPYAQRVSVLPIAWNPVGIGPTWTGVAMTLIVMAALVYLVFATEFFSKWPWSRNKLDAYGAQRQRGITRGILICDWVDVDVLTSVAKQKKVDPDPDRLERGSQVTTSGHAEAGRGPLRGKLSRERKRDERSYYDQARDPNGLLIRVLASLTDWSSIDGSSIDDDLDVVWGPTLLGDEALDEVVRAVRDKEELESARDAVRALQSAAVGQRVGEAWKMRAEKPRLVLVESEWTVRRTTVPSESAEQRQESYHLQLAHLRQRVDSYPPDAFEYGEGAYQQIAMPADLGMTVRLPFAHLTDPGRGRLRDMDAITAGVFGTTAASSQVQER